MLKHRAKSLNQSRVYPLGALTMGLKGQRLTEMAELTDAGCVAFTHADHPLIDTLVLSRALDYALTFGFAVWLRPQDAFLADGGVAHDGEVATRLGLAAIPATAETIALSAILQLVRANRARCASVSAVDGAGCRDGKSGEAGRAADYLRRGYSSPASMRP
jgi:dihydroorotase